CGENVGSVLVFFGLARLDYTSTLIVLSARRTVSRCVAFLIRPKKQLRRKFDFRRGRSSAFVLSNRDGPLRYQPRGAGGRCTLKVHLLTVRIPNTTLMLPSSLHRSE